MATADTVFRDYVTDGVPSSGANKPKKSEIRALLNAMATGGADGIYDFIPASNTGAGTANALKATTAVALPSTPNGALVAVNVYEDNTATPVTVQFNGGTVFTVKTNAGNNPAVGGLKAGSVIAGYISDTTFRLLSDQASAAVQAAVEAMLVEAEAARDAAQGYAADAAAASGLVAFASVANLLSDNNVAIGYAGSGAAVEVDAGVAVSAEGYRYSVAASAATDHDVITAGGVKLYVQPSNGSFFLPAFGAVLDGTTDDAAIVQKMMDAASARGVGTVYLGGKPLSIETKINVPSWITVHGGSLLGGRAKVNWRGVGADSLYQGCFQVVGAVTGSQLTIDTAAPEYSPYVGLATVGAVAVGDYIITQPQAPYTNTNAYAQYFGRVMQITASKTAWLSYEKRLPIGTDCLAQKVIAKTDVVISSIDFEGFGQTSRSNGMGAIFLSYTDRCKVRDCTAKGFWFKGILVQFSTNCDVDGMETFYPAATGAGEGYNVQFSYSHIGKIRNAKSWLARHCVDVTASSKIEMEDCYAYYSPSNAFSLHSACEYDIGWTRCHTLSCESSFALGGMNTGFADKTDKLRITDCTSILSTNYALVHCNMGRGLTVKGFKATRASANSNYTVTLANNDAMLSDVDIEGGLLVTNASGPLGNSVTDGYTKIVGGALRRTAVGVSRGLSLANVIAGVTVELTNVDISGAISMSGGGNKVIKSGGDWRSSTTDASPFFTSGILASDTLRFIGGTVSVLGTASATIAFTGSYTFDGTEFVAGRTDLVCAFATGKVAMKGVTGALRATFASTLTLIDLDALSVVHGAPIITLVSFTKQFKLTDSTLTCTSGSAVTATGAYEANVQNNTVIKGGCDLSTSVQGIISGNTFDSSTLPTGTASLLVGNNLNLGARV